MQHLPLKIIVTCRLNLLLPDLFHFTGKPREYMGWASKPFTWAPETPQSLLVH